MFSAEDRLIFRYQVGPKEIAADPDVLYRRMRGFLGSHEGLDLQRAVKMAFGANEEGFTPAPEERDAAMTALIDLAAMTLGQPRLTEDGKGMTEAELWGAFSAFMDFLEDSKKKDGSSPNSSSSAGGPTGSATPTSSG